MNTEYLLKCEMNLKWRDLTILSPHEICLDLILWTPWLLIAWISVYYGLWLLAVIGWFFFFLTGLRLSHEAFHRNLGLPVFVCDFILFLLSPLMLSCLHATRYTHLQHHRHCLKTEDIEGLAAKYTFFEAIYKGFQYPILSHRFAWNSNDLPTKFWIKIELLWIICFYCSGFYFCNFLFLSHFFAMLIADCMASFFAVWMVHHDCNDMENPARTIRGLWRSLLTYNMFYHYEHHALPRVPTRHLPELAKRLDAIGRKNFRKAF